MIRYLLDKIVEGFPGKWIVMSESNELLKCAVKEYEMVWGDITN